MGDFAGVVQMGRKTKLTQELQDQICRVLRAGNYIEDTCAYVGIAESTFYEWVRRGERGWKIDREAGYSEFSEAVKKARAEAAVSSVARIRKAAQGELEVKRKVTTKSDGTQVIETTLQPPQWQADAWYLERSYPHRWGRRVMQQEITGEDGGEVTIRVVYDESNGDAS